MISKNRKTQFFKSCCIIIILTFVVSNSAWPYEKSVISEVPSLLSWQKENAANLFTTPSISKQYLLKLIKVRQNRNTIIIARKNFLQSLKYQAYLFSLCPLSVPVNKEREILNYLGAKNQGLRQGLILIKRSFDKYLKPKAVRFLRQINETKSFDASNAVTAVIAGGEILINLIPECRERLNSYLQKECDLPLSRDLKNIVSLLELIKENLSYEKTKPNDGLAKTLYDVKPEVVTSEVSKGIVVQEMNSLRNEYLRLKKTIMAEGEQALDREDKELISEIIELIDTHVALITALKQYLSSPMEWKSYFNQLWQRKGLLTKLSGKIDKRIQNISRTCSLIKLLVSKLFNLGMKKEMLWWVDNARSDMRVMKAFPVSFLKTFIIPLVEFLTFHTYLEKNEKHNNLPSHKNNLKPQTVSFYADSLCLNGFKSFWRGVQGPPFSCLWSLLAKVILLSFGGNRS